MLDILSNNPAAACRLGMCRLVAPTAASMACCAPRQDPKLERPPSSGSSSSRHWRSQHSSCRLCQWAPPQTPAPAVDNSNNAGCFTAGEDEATAGVMADVQCILVVPPQVLSFELWLTRPSFQECSRPLVCRSMQYSQSRVAAVWLRENLGVGRVPMDVS